MSSSKTHSFEAPLWQESVVKAKLLPLEFFLEFQGTLLIHHPHWQHQSHHNPDREEK